MRTADMPVLQLRGSARERGHAHGEALRSQIGALVGEVKEAIGHKAGLQPDAYFDEFFSGLKVWEPLAQQDPTFLQEIEAIAQASGQRVADIAVLNLLDEELWYGRGRLMGASAAEAASHNSPHDKCSVFAAVEAGVTLLGQNMDIASWTDGKQVLLHVQPEGTDLEYYAFSCAGMLGLCGVNNRGLGACVNTLMHLDPAPDGRPVVSIMRDLLSSANLDAAARILKRSRHASGQCYTLAERGRIAGFECSATQCVEYNVWAGRPRLVHTNHALANPDATEAARLKPRGLALGLPKFFFNVTRDSLARQAEMQQLFGDFAVPVTPELAMRALAQTTEGGHPICHPGSSDRPNGFFTTGSVIWELGAQTRARVAAGPPNVTEYRTFGF